MELICKNDKFDDKTLAVFNKYQIKLPVEGDIYELLRVVKYPRIKKTGLIVKPLENQFISGSIMGESGQVEVSFDKSRFATLLGLDLTEEILEEFKQQEKLEKVYVKKLDKPYQNN
jgi:hypothetical protein